MSDERRSGRSRLYTKDGKIVREDGSAADRAEPTRERVEEIRTHYADVRAGKAFADATAPLDDICTLLARIAELEGERDGKEGKLAQAEQERDILRITCDAHITVIGDKEAALAQAEQRVTALQSWKHVCTLEACCIENGIAALTPPAPQSPSSNRSAGEPRDSSGQQPPKERIGGTIHPTPAPREGDLQRGGEALRLILACVRPAPGHYAPMKYIIADGQGRAFSRAIALALVAIGLPAAPPPRGRDER